MRGLVGFAVVGMAAALVACGGGTTPPADNNNNNDGGNNGGNGDGSTASVDVRDNSFSPDSVRVVAGGTVTWTWGGYDSHNVTFATPGVGNSETQIMGTHDVTFAEAGTFEYQCTRHSGMNGKVLVQ
jgi:plastocyanin